MPKTTQCDRVLRHLSDYGSITSLEAISEYGILRLASRISDLKIGGTPSRQLCAPGRTGTTKPPITVNTDWRKEHELKMRIVSGQFSELQAI